ncbi:MAG: type II toxin-antitoxin system VapC family toxin [Armatimonadetes bacterium]|jgi:predicted nucleic acid-binding protein|nr:type II toxin-antitoxin system VapC family toxin [Armatimonadota bacterium]
MAAYFMDSSAAAKRHVAETGSAWVRAITNIGAGNWIYVARITAVEVVAALARRQRAGSLTAAELGLALAEWRAAVEKEFLVEEVTAPVLDRAMLLAEKYALRGYDAVQLAAALITNEERLVRKLPALVLVSADEELNAAAAAEGLVVENPNTH